MRRALLVVVGVLVVLLVGSQLFLPGFAESRLKSSLERDGTGVDVSVESVPALKLLLKRADKVTVSVRELRTQDGGGGGEKSVGDRLAETAKVGEIDASVGVLEAGDLRAERLRFRKRGDTLTAEVEISREDLDAALPPNLEVEGSSGEEGLVVSGQTSVFGRDVSGRAKVSLDEGKIVISPLDIPFGSLVSYPVFSDERVSDDAIDALATEAGFQLTARGHLR
jgi:hypothetical protein